MASLFVGRDNSFGVLRLIMALSVVVSHVRPVGFDRPDPGQTRFGGQITLGRIAVYGFFILSGFLVTRSALRVSVGRFLWSRALRIFPGLWACLLATAFVAAPILYHHNHGTFSGFLHAGDGPVAYFQNNWATGTKQNDVSAAVLYPKLRGGAHVTGIDGALWSLCYEATCYIILAVLAVTGVLRYARKFVAAIAVGLWLYLLTDLLAYPNLLAPQKSSDFNIDIPILVNYMGPLLGEFMVYLGFAFILGALVQLYSERIPINDVLGIGAGIVFVASLLAGGFYVIGIPAFVYLLFWLAIRLPRPFRRVGRKHDFSYGIYIYGWVVEQMLVIFGYSRHGEKIYLLLAIAGSFLCAIPSWFLVEKQFLRLKDVDPVRFFREPGSRRPAASESAPIPDLRPASESLLGA